MGSELSVMEEPPPHDDTSRALTMSTGVARGMARHISAGTVAIESDRAIAEAQGKLIIAQRCPRNRDTALEELLRSCQEPALAEVAFYKFNRGSENVTGPSIRFAEELARCWGNIEYGVRELSQKPGVSEMQAFAWDLQTNTLSTQNFTVAHIRDTRQGPKPLTQQRDIYELTANMGGRRLRSRILAIMPKWLVETGIEECRKTLKSGDAATIAERSRKMIAAFVKLGVTTPMLESKIGKKIAQIDGEDLVTLLGVHSGIKDGMSSVAEEFAAGAEEGGQSLTGGTGLAASLATSGSPKVATQRGATTTATATKTASAAETTAAKQTSASPAQAPTAKPAAAAQTGAAAKTTRAAVQPVASAPPQDDPTPPDEAPPAAEDEETLF